MWWVGLDTIGVGIVLVMLVSLMFAVLILQRQRSQKTIGILAGSLLVGILLGSALTLGALRLIAYRQRQGIATASPAGNQGESSGMRSPGGSMGGMGSGMGSGMGGGMGAPNPKRDLTTLVRKLDLLTGKIRIMLTAEQAASLTAELADIEKAEKMSDDDAKAKHDALMALLDDDQKSQLDAVGLPRPQRGPGGPGGGAGGPGGGPGGPGGGPGGPAGSPPAADANPFQQETNAEVLKSLRQRFAPEAPKVDAGESRPPEAPKEAAGESKPPSE